MPHYRTPHDTDGPGIGAELKGSKLTVRLAHLASEANSHHRSVEEHWQGMLLHAKQAGEALIEAKRRLGHRTKWSKWRYHNFRGSPETSRVYVRIARDWQDPRIQEARFAGVKIESIKTFLSVLKGEPTTRNIKEPTSDEQRLRAPRDRVQKEFNRRLSELTSYELEILTAPDLETFNGLWDQLRSKLRALVQNLVGDVYEDARAEQEESAKLKTRRRCIEAGKRLAKERNSSSANTQLI